MRLLTFQLKIVNRLPSPLSPASVTLLHSRGLNRSGPPPAPPFPLGPPSPPPPLLAASAACAFFSCFFCSFSCLRCSASSCLRGSAPSSAAPAWEGAGAGAGAGSVSWAGERPGEVAVLESEGDMVELARRWVRREGWQARAGRSCKRRARRGDRMTAQAAEGGSGCEAWELKGSSG